MKNSTELERIVDKIFGNPYENDPNNLTRQQANDMIAEYVKQMLIAFRTQQAYGKNQTVPELMKIHFKIDVENFLRNLN